MDITLKRILSLLPTNPNGSVRRGAKKDFAISLGYDSGDIVSMWIKGTSKSYLNKLHEISIKYNVSVEWLKGESDEKAPAPKGERASDDDIRFALFDGYDNITDEMYEEVKRFARMVRLREEAEREKEK